MVMVPIVTANVASRGMRRYRVVDRLATRIKKTRFGNAIMTSCVAQIQLTNTFCEASEVKAPDRGAPNPRTLVRRPLSHSSDWLPDSSESLARNPWYIISLKARKETRKAVVKLPGY